MRLAEYYNSLQRERFDVELRLQAEKQELNKVEEVIKTLYAARAPTLDEHDTKIKELRRQVYSEMRRLKSPNNDGLKLDLQAKIGEWEEAIQEREKYLTTINPVVAQYKASMKTLEGQVAQSELKLYTLCEKLNKARSKLE
ncbi:hypothetical protein BC835DRAFT_1310181 [Cytidiella melzeri]|nr:hypothetical protein BC835DRAFT_1310181 [Cytidiella melzeri]